MANDPSFSLRKELTRINNKLTHGNYKTSPQEFDDLKIPSSFQASSLSLPSHILSPTSTSSPSPLPSPSPSPSTSSLLSPLTTNANGMASGATATSSSSSCSSSSSSLYSSAIPKFDFFDRVKVGDKRKFDQFAQSNADHSSQQILDEIQSSLCDDSNDDFLHLNSNETLRCNQYGDNDLSLSDSKKKKTSFLACDYTRRDKSKLQDLITFDRSLFALPATVEEEERGEINIQIKKKSDIAQNNRSKITLVYNDHGDDDDQNNTLYYDPAIPNFPPVAPAVYLNQQKLIPFLFPATSENIIDYCKKLDERNTYLAKELSKLPKNGITYRIVDDHQIKLLAFDIQHNKQVFNIQMSIPLDYPNLSPKYEFYENFSEPTKGFQMILEKFEQQLVSTANPTVSDILTSFVTSIEIC